MSNRERSCSATTESAASLPMIVEGCLESLLQCRRFVAALPEEVYAGRRKERSGIGAHVRHCLDHYFSLFGGIESRRVDYDARERSQELERNRAKCLQAIDEVMEELCGMGALEMDLPLEVVQSCCSRGRCSPMPTTLGRELLFLSGHVTHHLALMRLLAEQAGCRTEAEVGVAFSTAAYQRARSMTG